MPKNRHKNSVAEQFIRIHDQFGELFPHLIGVLADEAEFNGLVLRVKEDGTVLGVLKAYDAGGSPVVCFGSGYGAVGALMALDRSVQGGVWKVDKPWDNGK